MPIYCIFRKMIPETKAHPAGRKLVVKRYRFEYPAPGKQVTRDTATKVTSMKFLGKIEAPTKKDALRKAIWQGMM